VLILLPPSEGKTRPARGRPVDPAALWLPELAPARCRALDALTGLCAGDPAVAAAALGVPSADLLTVNAGLATAPARRADAVYSGVLYEALDLPTLPPAARAAVTRSTVVFSGLWGVLRLGDRIPAYRCAIGARLPGVGGLGAYWRRELRVPLDAAAGTGVVLDLRSGAYAATWAPGPRGLAVRVLHERRVGDEVRRSVVSHVNKATKGRLVRDLAAAGALAPRRPTDLVATLRDLKYTVEEPRPGQLDVVVTQL
jgi:uncharacterized protein